MRTWAKRQVDMPSSVWLRSGFMVAIMLVLQFPPSESRRTCFSFRVVGLLESAADPGY